MSTPKTCLGYQVEDAADHRGGFAGAGARQNQERLVWRRQRGVALLLVQVSPGLGVRAPPRPGSLLLLGRLRALRRRLRLLLLLLQLVFLLLLPLLLLLLLPLVFRLPQPLIPKGSCEALLLVLRPPLLLLLFVLVLFL
jgi:hypothetical protein